jgi:AraC-like DNA-binding protein
MAVLVQMCRITAGTQVRPELVQLCHRVPSCGWKFEKFFQCPVQFSQNKNLLLFNRTTLDRVLPTSHPELARANDKIVADYLEIFTRKSLQIKVREQVIERLPGGTPNEQTIAAKLNMSLRNLQRQLKSENCSYKKILDDTRKDLALRYLEDSNRQIIEISYLLGFSEQSNFSRAFKRWTGTTPNRHRANSSPERSST